MSWNDSWVEKSNRAELDEGIGRGKKWLVAILVSCGVLYALSLAALIYMFVVFTGCPTNNTFISLTLLLCIAITGAQLSGEEGSLLASACITAWATYLSYGAVTKNLNKSCNPTLGEPTPSTIALGLAVTIISLAYTGFSYTAEDKLRVRPKNNDDEVAVATTTTDVKANENGGNNNMENRKVTGVAVNGGNYGSAGGDGDKVDSDGPGHGDDEVEEGEGGNSAADNDPSQLSNSWRLNIAMCAVACWTAMILTHWGAVQSRGSLANPSASNVAMWIVIASQWLVMLLYFWILIAPRLFPNRDFS